MYNHMRGGPDKHSKQIELKIIDKVKLFLIQKVSSSVFKNVREIFKFVMKIFKINLEKFNTVLNFSNHGICQHRYEIFQDR